MFQIFAYLLKKKKNLISRTVAYFAVDSEMKLFFPTLFFFISKKLHYHYNQEISIYICDSPLILLISLSLLNFLSFSLHLTEYFDKCSIYFQVQEVFYGPFGLRGREGEQSRVDLVQNQPIFSLHYSTPLYSPSIQTGHQCLLKF